MRKRYAILELILVTAIIAVGGAAMLIAINPYELINRSGDTALFITSSEIYGALMGAAASSEISNFLEDDVSAVSLDSLAGRKVLSSLASFREIKEEFIISNAKNLSRVFLTAKRDLSSVSVCFKPASASYLLSAENYYNVHGGRGRCGRNCYICIENGVPEINKN